MLLFNNLQSSREGWKEPMLPAVVMWCSARVPVWHWVILRAIRLRFGRKWCLLRHKSGHFGVNAMVALNIHPPFCPRLVIED